MWKILGSMVENILEEWKELSLGSQDSENQLTWAVSVFLCVCVAVSVYELENCNII